jgi:hypothetical protein
MNFYYDPILGLQYIVNQIPKYYKDILDMEFYKKVETSGYLSMKIIEDKGFIITSDFRI